jgi:hypothetical protein
LVDEPFQRLIDEGKLMAIGHAWRPSRKSRTLRTSSAEVVRPGRCGISNTNKGRRT